MAIPDKPVTRKEAYLSTIAGQPVELPTPVTRTELYLEAIAKQGTGGGGGAGIFGMSFLNVRSDSGTSIGFRSAFYGKIE